MKLIERKYYLRKILALKNTPDIKVITGVRRCGKSKLLLSLIDHIKQNESNSNIVLVDFHNIEFDSLKDYKKLNEYILKNYQKDQTNYLMIDEVQLCKNFELTINSIHNSEKFDIYITGSNAFLLSSDLATLFTGRTMHVEVFPFSFDEFLLYFDELEKKSSFDAYFGKGGMAGTYVYENEENSKKYLQQVYNTIITRDLVEKYNIQDKLTLLNIADYLMDNISNLTSPNKITELLNKKKSTTNHVTVGNYINYLCNSFLFYKVKRYDIRGKKYLETTEKYYLVDHGFRIANLGKRNIDYGRVYENMVAISLLKRGYDIYVGKLYEKEIDFVAIKSDEKIYIQVSSFIEDEKVLKREVESLLSIRDAHPKIIIARTRQDEYTYEGIKIIDVAKWLSNNKY